MHIGIDATALYGRYGGVQYALWNLLYALSRQNDVCEYSVFIPADGPPSRLRQMFDARWQWRVLPFAGTERLKRIIWQQTQLPAILKQIKCDLLYAPTYVAPVWSPVPVVLTVFDVIALEHPQFATAPNRLHYQLLLPPSLRRAACIAAPSDAVREKIGLRFGAKVLLKTHVVPLGLEPLFFAQPHAAQMDEVHHLYHLPQKYFLYVGNREPKKNIGALTAAYQLLSRQRGNLPSLVLAGGARPWRNQGTQANPAIHEIGYVRRRHLPALFAGSVGLIFPTLAEGFGLPVLEALACGTPVITTRAVPIAGIEKQVQLIDPRQPLEIAIAMERLLDNPELTTAAHEKGPRFAASFTWQRAAAQMREMFTAAVRAPRA